MTLARLFQPCPGGDRGCGPHRPGQRSTVAAPAIRFLLNKLLNEMDGLRPDADILFVLTTNRPEVLEEAPAARPGSDRPGDRVPVPRRGGAGEVDPAVRPARGHPGGTVVERAVARTAGVSALFIKELMCRSAQAGIGRDGGATIRSADLGEALDDMLFASGKLNIKLLGGAQEARPEMING